MVGVVEVVYTLPGVGTTPSRYELGVVVHPAGRSSRRRLTALAAAISAEDALECEKAATMPPASDASSTTATTATTPARRWRRAIDPPWASTMSRHAS